MRRRWRSPCCGTSSPCCADRWPGSAPRSPTESGGPPCPGSCDVAAAEIFSVTPATILAGHRSLVSRKGDYTARRPPRRPPDRSNDQETGDPHGSRESHLEASVGAGELVRLGHRIAASTVWQILHDTGIDSAPSPVRSDLASIPHRASWRLSWLWTSCTWTRVPQANLRAHRGRAWLPLAISARGDSAPNRGVDDPGRPQPADGPRRPSHHREVPAPRP